MHLVNTSDAGVSWVNQTPLESLLTGQEVDVGSLLVIYLPGGVQLQSNATGYHVGFVEGHGGGTCAVLGQNVELGQRVSRIIGPQVADPAAAGGEDLPPCHLERIVGRDGERVLGPLRIGQLPADGPAVGDDLQGGTE